LPSTLARFGSVAPVLLSVTFVQLALGVLSPLISLLLTQRGVPTPYIGLVTSGYSLGFLAGSLTCARIVDRVGHIRAFAVFAALAADCVLLHATVSSTIAWGVLRAATGYTMAGVFLIAESWLNDKADATSRGRIFASYLVVSWGPAAVGPLALNFTHPVESFLFILIAIGFSTALVPMALTQVSNPEIAGRVRFGVRHLFAISPLGVVSCFAAGLVNSAFFGLLPVYGNKIGLGASGLSFVLTTALIGGLVSQYPIGMLSDRFGRRPVMLTAILAAIVLALAMMLVGERSYSALLALAFVYAGMTAPLYGLGVGQTNDYITPKEFVGASSGLLFAWALGASAGPAAASGVMGVLGPHGLFLYIAGVLGLVAIFTVFRMLRRTGLPVAQQSGFVAAPQTPPRIAELDPRSGAATDATLSERPSS
jgi:MFS family permease